MLLRFWSFLTFMVVALLMGTSFAHALEKLQNVEVDESLRMTFQRTL